jgi:hypothetical protein
VPTTRRQFTAEFWEGAVPIARETSRPIAQIARALGINAGTRGELDRQWAWPCSASVTCGGEETTWGHESAGVGGVLDRLAAVDDHGVSDHEGRGVGAQP